MPETASPETDRVGFIGLGNIGGAMVTRIIGAGFPTVLWARRPDAIVPFAGALVETAESPAALASRADVVGICVWSDEDVQQVMLGSDGVLAGCRPGTVVAIHSTTQPATCRSMADAGRELNVSVIDAPVSGGRDGALAGTVVVAVGGDEAAAARYRPVLDSFAEDVVHLGPVGSAQFAKLVNNALTCRQPVPGRRRPDARRSPGYRARRTGPGAQAGHRAQLRARHRPQCPDIAGHASRRPALPREGRDEPDDG